MKELTETGYAVVPDVIDSEEVGNIGELISGALAGGAGTRRLIEMPWCQDLADRLTRDPRLRNSLPTEPIAVQCTLFIKSARTNWLVSLHQDLSVPVAERVESPYCSGWSEKEGDIFVQPPVHLLERMLAVRVHLDDSCERNGALRVVPCSHRLGRLTPEAALRARSERGRITSTYLGEARCLCDHCCFTHPPRRRSTAHAVCCTLFLAPRSCRKVCAGLPGSGHR